MEGQPETLSPEAEQVESNIADIDQALASQDPLTIRKVLEDTKQTLKTLAGIVARGGGSR